MNTGVGLRECAQVLRRHGGDENAAFEDLLLSGMVGGPQAPAVMHGDEEEEMLRRAQQLSLEAAEEEEARREEENARFEALEAELFLEAQQASLNEEDAELIQALLQAQQASLQEEEERRRQLAKEEEDMLTRVQQFEAASLFEVGRGADAGDGGGGAGGGGGGGGGGGVGGGGGGVGGAHSLDWEPAGSTAVAEAEEEAAVASGCVADEVLARCQAYVVDGRTDSMVFAYTSKAAHRVVRDEAEAWGLACSEVACGPMLPGLQPCVIRPATLYDPACNSV